MDENQTLYSGAYTVDVYFLDINDGNTWKYMPGGFTGLHNNKNVVFETLNAIHIDTFGEN